MTITTEIGTFAYNANGWSLTRAANNPIKLSSTVHVGRDGASFVTAMGKVLATVDAAEIAAVQAAEMVARDARIAAARKPSKPLSATAEARRYGYVGGCEDYGGDWQRNGRGEWVR